MNPKTIFIMTVLAGSLALLGAGCGQGVVAVPAPLANSESDISMPTGNLQDNSRSNDTDQAAAAAQDQTGAAVNQPQPSTPPQPRQLWPRPTEFPGVLSRKDIHDKQARIVTAKGTIVLRLFDADAPKAVSNFVALANSGYFNGLIFHRVVPGFVIQGGDPLGNGFGGPGYKFADEKVTRDYLAGTVAMANSGPDSNGSQFFICLADQPSLDKLYTIFGQVTAGLDVVRSIAVGDVMESVTIEDAK